MKPGEHPEFYRIAPPEGGSRESSIVLDREGHFWHEGEIVENRALEMAMRGLGQRRINKLIRCKPVLP